jgi:hypothetical protein
VPLALIYWSGNGLEFVDCWAVRRRPVTEPLSAGWPSLSGQRLRAENEARLFQFQAHLNDVVAETTTPSTLDGTQYFHFLPPVGLLPVQGSNRPLGFSYLAFFTQSKFREHTIFVEGSRLRSLVEHSFCYPPIDLASEEMVWIYHARENYQPRPGEVVSSEPPYAIFTSPYIPFAADARFDIQRWNYANFGLL